MFLVITELPWREPTRTVSSLCGLTISLISRTNEYTLVFKPPFGRYEIISARGMSVFSFLKLYLLLNLGVRTLQLVISWYWLISNKNQVKQRDRLRNQFEEKKPSYEKKVYKCIKVVLDAWSVVHENRNFQPGFQPGFSSIYHFILLSFVLLTIHELLFDSINELIFEFYKFLQWVSLC